MTVRILCICIISVCVLFAEDWPGYEKDNLHQNASATDINPATVVYDWEHDFSNPVGTGTTNPGHYGSRNLSLVDGKIAIVARHNSTTGAGNRAYVTILDCTDGSTLTVLRTLMGPGPRRDQFNGYGSVYMEAYDTGIGHIVSFWDPTSGILYMASGGDGADQTAYLPLANQGDFAAAQSSGDWYIYPVGAYADLYTNHPGIQDDKGNTPQALEDKSLSYEWGDYHFDLNYGQVAGWYSNQSGFFEVDLSGSLIVKPNGSGHAQASGYMLVHKDTGLTARWKNGLSEVGTIEPPAYSPALTWSSFRIFKMYGGSMVHNGKVYFMGPGDDSDGNAELGDSGIFGPGQVRDQGLYISCVQHSLSDNNPNDGYTGPGAAESAAYPSGVWNYRYVSSNTPTNYNNNESWLESDGFHRNKAWLIEDDETVWCAWKPTQAGNVELIHCGPSSLSDTFDLGVCAGMRGQDIWPHISYINLGASEEYIVYYAGNAYYKAHSGGSLSSGWDTSATGSQPLGPAQIAVFDADAGSVKWTYTLNAADASGPFASLPPNEATGYFDRSQMLVAGQYAWVAWVDLSGTNAVLTMVPFDITAASAPSTPPTPVTRDLGVLSADAEKSCVTDLIAADGSIYALVTISDVWDTCNHTFDSQRIVAFEDPGSVTDGDGDGMPDSWELTNFGDLDQTELTDFDNDSVLDIDEYTNGTDPDDNTDPSPELSFSASSYSVTEGTASVTITVNRSVNSANAVSVAYATTDGTADSGDYTAASGSLNWGDGVITPQTFTINITDDSDVESAQTVTITLSSPSGAIITGTNPVTLTINDNDVIDGDGDGMDDSWEMTNFGDYDQDETTDFDNDGVLDIDEFDNGTNPNDATDPSPELSFSASSYSVTEGTPQVTITVTRSVNSAGTVGLSYATTNGTATAGSDYTAASGTLSFSSGSLGTDTFTIDITDDTDVETAQTLTITLSSPTGGAVITGTNPVTLTINDNDTPTTTSEGSEGGCLPASGMGLSGMLLAGLWLCQKIREK